MKSPGAARAGADSLLGRRVHMLRVRLRDASLWPIHCPHMAVKVTVIKQFLCTQKTEFPYGPWKPPGRLPGQLPTAVFVLPGLAA